MDSKSSKEFSFPCTRYEHIIPQFKMRQLDGSAAFVTQHPSAVRAKPVDLYFRSTMTSTTRCFAVMQKLVLGYGPYQSQENPRSSSTCRPLLCEAVIRTHNAG